MARQQTNEQGREIQAIPFAAGQTRESPLLRGVALTGLLLRITATVNFSQNTSRHSAQDFGIAKLLRRVQILRDGEAVVDARGDQLFTFQRMFLSNQGPELNRVDPTAAGDQDISASILIPFQPTGLLSEAFKLCHWPALVRIGQQFDLQVEWEDGVVASSGSSDEGTAALVDGSGDDDVTWTTEPEVTGFQRYNAKADPVGPNSQIRWPAFAPRIRAGQVSDRFTAATDEIRLELTSQFPILAMHLREARLTGNDQVLEELIDRLEFTHDEDELRETARALVFEDQAQDFQAVGRSLGGSASGTGELFFNYAKDGKVGGVVQPLDLTDPRYVFSTLAPTNNDESRIEAVRFELTQIPGATAGTEALR